MANTSTITTTVPHFRVGQVLKVALGALVALIVGIWIFGGGDKPPPPKDATVGSLEVYAKSEDLAKYAEKGDLVPLATKTQLDALGRRLDTVTKTASQALSLSTENDKAISALHATVLETEKELRKVREETHAQWVHLKRRRLDAERTTGEVAIIEGTLKEVRAHTAITRDRVEAVEASLSHLSDPNAGKVGWQEAKRADPSLKAQIERNQAKR